jgi:hypothetical protein
VVRHAKEFEPTELVTLAKVTGGTVETHSPPAELEALHAPGWATASTSQRLPYLESNLSRLR